MLQLYASSIGGAWPFVADMRTGALCLYLTCQTRLSKHTQRERWVGWDSVTLDIENVTLCHRLICLNSSGLDEAKLTRRPNHIAIMINVTNTRVTRPSSHTFLFLFEMVTGLGDSPLKGYWWAKERETDPILDEIRQSTSVVIHTTRISYHMSLTMQGYNPAF